MKKYKFTIQKIIERQVEIKAENNKEVLKKLLSFLTEGDEKFCENIIEYETKYNIKLNDIFEKNNHKVFKDNDEINVDIIDYLLSNDEENFEKEHIEICCERCGNCILIDDIIHQLYS